MTEDIKNQIKSDYLKIKDFRNNALGKLAEKYGITLDELLDIIEL